MRQLVDEALKNNPSLEATALRLKSAEYMLAGARARLLPQASTQFTQGRNNQDINPATGSQKTSDSSQFSFGVSWELDLWGRLANEQKASQQTVLAQGFDYLQIRDALAARVIQTWIEQVAIRRFLDIEKERLTVLQRIETNLIERYRGGIGSLDELSTAKSRTEIARADLSARNAALLKSIRRLEVLLGRYPQGSLESGADLPEIPVPPASIPTTVLLNRPDIRAALARVEAASNTSRATDKTILPGLQLSGQVFREASSLNGLGRATSSWSLLGTLFQPLFEGGRLIGESKAMRVEAKASLQDLREVVLQALSEVENAFDTERDLAAQSVALDVAVNESAASSRYYEDRYQQGLDTIQSLLIAKEQEMAVRLRQCEVIAERWSNRIDLALALGMGIDKRPVAASGGAKDE